ncbi:alginate lyase [Coprinopsis cinerea okayama7|uniref:Alginate lyase n=1 Tax=Coprinopsis cinerea (strain Okayama-7 / 130 / ATCC MYA-4618 / FGSC 9003) TaxID=240176 RepID=A8P9Z6_COPC7|nr:alginate lyase [Coprinopsis cinerea okayama7\|eukprot:XP_001839870.2 alginate lyase [Coprinopsis cinerea okayama7\
MPRMMKDLSSFNVTSPSGQKNVQFVTGIPSRALPTASSGSSDWDRSYSWGGQAKGKVRAQAQNSGWSSGRDGNGGWGDDGDEEDQDGDEDGDGEEGGGSGNGEVPPISNWHPDEVSLQVLYPKGSINPAQKPQGGAEFYASPIDLSAAFSSSSPLSSSSYSPGRGSSSSNRNPNVTLRYSVYFPLNFDWVLAGKLPGLYGGHTGCSGGNAALDCFSTRLMWRQGGVGELYLYASKTKQPPSLCSDPQSVCDAAYGFSVGRGSFRWVPGQWTTVEQTVVLNTPGRGDGWFVLDVNGRRVVERGDVFYRDVLWPSGGGGAGGGGGGGKGGSEGGGEGKEKTSTGGGSPKPTPPPPPPRPTPPSNDPLGDILGPLLSQIGKLIRRDGGVSSTVYEGHEDGGPTTTKGATTTTASSSTLEAARGEVAAPTPRPPVQAVDEAAASTPTPDSSPSREGGRLLIRAAQPERQGNSIGFIGIFFSTFFGGHADKYATPRDQYVWFKDFALAVND